MVLSPKKGVCPNLMVMVASEVKVSNWYEVPSVQGGERVF